MFHCLNARTLFSVDHDCCGHCRECGVSVCHNAPSPPPPPTRTVPHRPDPVWYIIWALVTMRWAVLVRVWSAHGVVVFLQVGQRRQRGGQVSATQTWSTWVVQRRSRCDVRCMSSEDKRLYLHEVVACSEEIDFLYLHVSSYSGFDCYI